MSPRYRIDAPRVVYELLDGEYVIINFESGHYYSLVGSGAEIWSFLDRQASLDQIVAALTERYGDEPATLERHARAFIDTLLAEQLVVPLPAEAEPGATYEGPAAGGPAHTPFEPPSLAVFSDMKEMLLLDPIHEVDASGWPAAKPPSDDADTVA